MNMARDYTNNVMGPEQYRANKEAQKRKLAARRKGHMKGLGYELILFIIAFAVTALVWTIMTYGTDMIFPVLLASTTDPTTITRINQMNNFLYFSLFFLFLLGIIWVWKTSHGQGAIQ